MYRTADTFFFFISLQLEKHIAALKLINTFKMKRKINPTND